MANKLYQLSYISDIIEQFARNMLLSAIDQNVSAVRQNVSQPGVSEQPEVEVDVQAFIYLPFCRPAII